MGSPATACLDASVFASLIGTNYSPTDEEIKQLNELLVAPTAARQYLREEITRVSSYLNNLRSQHDQLSCRIDAYRTIMSPIHRLPFDILQEIFLQCMPDNHYPIMSRYEPPMLLTQVCSSWRRIAHSMPSLWRAIYITVPSAWTNHHSPESPSTSAMEAVVATIQKRAIGVTQWLSRAAKCPLHIHVFSRTSRVSDPSYETIVTSLIAFSRRWQDVTFSNFSQEVRKVLALSDSDLPILRSFTVQGGDVSNYMTASRLPTVDYNEHRGPRVFMRSNLFRAPQLRQVAYNRVHENFLLFPLRWDQLTDISLTGGGVASIMTLDQILRRCPVLVNGTFDLTPLRYTGGGDVTLAPNIHSSLQTLTLQGYGSDLAWLFRALETPALEKLALYTRASNNPSTFPGDVIYFFERSCASLKTLVMDPCFLDKDSMRSCLRNVPSLTSLILRRSNFPDNGDWTGPIHGDPTRSAVQDDVLMSFIDDADPLVVNLATFECDVTNNLTDEALLIFIRTKLSPRAPASNGQLKKVVVSLGRRQTLPTITAALKECIKAGLDYRLLYNPPLKKARYTASDGL